MRWQQTPMPDHCKECEVELSVKWRTRATADAVPRMRCPRCTEGYVLMLRDLRERGGLSALVRECNQIRERHHGGLQ